MPVGNMTKKLKSFGFKVTECDGNDVLALCKALDPIEETNMPKAFVLHTVPGKGVSFMENDPVWHGNLPSEIARRAALRELKKKEREIKAWQTFLKEIGGKRQ